MTFQFRVMVHRNKLSPEFLANIHKTDPKRYPDGYAYYADIREVYYKDGAPDGREITPEWVEGWTSKASKHEFDALSPGSDMDDRGPIYGIAEDIKYYVLAVSLPPLNEWELPGYKGD